MASKLPDKPETAPLGKGDLARFARLEGQIEKAMKVAAEPIGAALRTIRDDKLYLATHSSFERYVVERWGLSKATAYRMMGVEKLVGISPPETVKPQVSASQSETIQGEPSTTTSPPSALPDDTLPSISDGPPRTTPSEGREARTRTQDSPRTGGAASPRGTQSPVGPDKQSEGAEDYPGSRGESAAVREQPARVDAPSGPSSEGTGEPSPPPGLVDGAATKRSSSPSVPSDPSALVLRDHIREPDISDADGLRWLNSKSEQEWRALGDPYGPGIRAAVKRAAKAFGFTHDPTVDPIPAADATRKANAPESAVVARRRATEAGVKPGEVVTNGRVSTASKLHDPSCGCLMCKPPKAVKA